MKNLLSIIHLLKRFGIYVYTGNRKDDIDLMMSEIKDLYDSGLLQQDQYLKAVLVLRSEFQSEE
ncbi:YqgQ family protein [Sporosarcina jiandibaonis]|uniref:YqgQ family protein n=1 Tax=Sporosarcina jiandibaonis TaxID=2715535 RepID=UPI0015532F9D|nr:YqgQ family protein [Sporosarcina jiandibaonis]